MSAGSTRARRLGLALGLSLAAGAAPAYEADVHYGLTLWLAQKAGFDDSQSVAIAVGNHRVDSGLMDTLEVLLEYACVGRFAEAAEEVQARHYPAAAKAPAAPALRAVVAGSATARKPLAELMARTAGKEGLLLSQFGAALHPLQDSWAHAGVPGTPAPGGGVVCDAGHASGHPVTRGGPNSHDAALTHRYAADVLPMARATYEALLAYPAIQGRSRKAAAFGELAQLIDRFARAATKSDKRAWFVAQGVADTQFLDGVSLPDGLQPGPLAFEGRKLPPLKGPRSTQHDAPAEVKAFFDGLIARWLGAESVDEVVAELSGSRANAAAGPPRPTAAQLREIVARMKLWKLRDHGSAAALAHAAAPLNARQLAEVERLAKRPGAFVAPATPAEAFYPLLAKGEHASPLLPYIVRTLPAAAPGGAARTIAIAKLRHTPYDTVGWVAERSAAGWVLVEVVAVVDQ